MRHLLAFLLGTLALPATATAQIQNVYFGDVASLLHRGERTVVWTISGDVVRGRLIEATDAWIRLERATGDLRLSIDDVQRVERAGDRIWNGAVIGGVTGFAAGAAAMATCDPGFMCDHSWESVLGCGGLAGAFGFGVGALVDWMIRPERLVFDRGAQPSRVTLTTALSPKRGSVTIQVTF
jgi:hypothetical protein